MSFILIFTVLVFPGCAGLPQEKGGIIPTGDVQPTPTKDVEGRHRYVLSLMTDEDWHGAAEQLELMTASHPNLSGPWVNLGIVRVRFGDSAAAELAFKHALDASAGNAEAYNQLGMLYRRSGRLEEARFIYTEGLEQAPNHPDLHWNLAILHDSYLTDQKQALLHYQRYQQLTKSDDAQLHNWIAKLREPKVPKDPVRMTAEAKQ